VIENTFEVDGFRREIKGRKFNSTECAGSVSRSRDSKVKKKTKISSKTKEETVRRIKFINF
jgi:hypothetical protein